MALSTGFDHFLNHYNFKLVAMVNFYKNINCLKLNETFISSISFRDGRIGQWAINSILQFQLNGLENLNLCEKIQDLSKGKFYLIQRIKRDLKYRNYRNYIEFINFKSSVTKILLYIHKGFLILWAMLHSNYYFLYPTHLLSKQLNSYFNCLET